MVLTYKKGAQALAWAPFLSLEYFRTNFIFFRTISKYSESISKYSESI